MRVLLAFAVAVLAAGVSAQQNTPTAPSDFEQLFHYEVNRARANPQAYDSERGFSGLLAGITPSRPLALNERLVTSSRFHSAEMAQHGYFAHTSPITGHQPNLMVRNAGYPLANWLQDAANNVESLAGRASSASSVSYDPVQAVADLIEDVGVNPPGHRYHLLAWGGNQQGIDFTRQFKEAGAGYATGIGWQGWNSGAYWTYHTGFRDSATAWITGVVYDDANTNGRFDSGEGLSGVTVRIYNASSEAQVGSTTTNAAGGYVLETSNGTWVLEVFGGGFSGTRWATVTISSNANTQVDFRSNSNNADINFGSWGALPDSASVNGTQSPLTGGGSGPGPGPGPGGNGDGSSSGGGGCTVQAGTGRTALLLALAVLALTVWRRRSMESRRA